MVQFKKTGFFELKIIRIEKEGRKRSVPLFSMWPAKLACDNLCGRRVGAFDFYGSEQFFLILPHRSDLLLPRPRLVGPRPVQGAVGAFLNPAELLFVLGAKLPEAGGVFFVEL